MTSTAPRSSIRQVKYLNNIVEQDHRGVKRVTRPMLGFKSFEAAQWHPRRYRAHAYDQERPTGRRSRGQKASLPAEQFYALAS